MSAKVAKLNEKVAVLLTKGLKDPSTALSPEYVYAQNQKSLTTAGQPIYEARSKPLVVLFMACAGALLVYGVAHLGVARTLLALLLCFLEYDVFSGILHIVLDCPDNIAVPILGQPCLEFQWHHVIPDDICQRDFLHVCGDLNLAVGAFSAFFLLTQPFSPLLAAIVGAKISMAYLGQFSHRSAHEISLKKRGPIVRALQNAGLIISVGDHHKHHTPPHDTNFCLIGPCNAVLSAVYRINNGRYLWIAILSLWTCACVPCLQLAHHGIAGLAA